MRFHEDTGMMGVVKVHKKERRYARPARATNDETARGRLRRNAIRMLELDRV